MKPSSGAIALFFLVGVLLGWLARGYIVKMPVQDHSAVPAPQSVSPFYGSGLSKTFTFVVSAGQGYQTIRKVGALINDAVMASNACYAKYDVATGYVGLVADAGDTLVAAALAGGTRLENSQCVIYSASVTSHGEGNKLMVSIPITFKPAFAGVKTVFVNATNAAGRSSELELLGSWVVPSGSGSTPDSSAMLPPK